MKKEIFINESMGETRIAIQEDGQIVEVYIERQDKQRMVGNIYKGKVENVLPGMQAAFVDIGYELNAFLPFSEIANPDYIIEDDADGNQKKKGKPDNIEVDLQTNQKKFCFQLISLVKMRVHLLQNNTVKYHFYTLSLHKLNQWFSHQLK